MVLRVSLGEWGNFPEGFVTGKWNLCNILLKKEGDKMELVRYRPVTLAMLTITLGVFTLLLTAVQPVRADSGNNLLGLLTCSATENSEDARAGLSSEEYEMLSLVNHERVEAGLAKLEPDPQLTGIARRKSRDMVQARYFGHRSRQLGSVYEQLEQSRIAYHAVAENLVGAPGGRRAHQSIMQSPAHRSNVLNPGFTRIGIGIVKGGPYGKMITQILMD